VTVRAVTTQNEIDADAGRRMPACPWPEEDEEAPGRGARPAVRVKRHENLDARPQLQLFGRALDQLSRLRFKKYVNTVAWHGYVGSPEMMAREAEVSGRGNALTEGGDDYKFADYLTNWSKWARPSPAF